MDGWMDRWMDGQMDGWTDGRNWSVVNRAVYKWEWAFGCEYTANDLVCVSHMPLLLPTEMGVCVHIHRALSATRALVHKLLEISACLLVCVSVFICQCDYMYVFVLVCQCV